MGTDRDDDFRSWVAARREPLRRSAYLMCGDWYLADDLVQDAMARLYSVWTRVSSRGDPDSYARRVVVNLLIDHRRRPSRRELAHDRIPDLVAAAASHDRVDETHGDAIAALAQVSAQQRAVLVLRFWDDFSVEQTASILEISTGTVKSRTARGLAALRTVLEDDHVDATTERKPR